MKRHSKKILRGQVALVAFVLMAIVVALAAVLVSVITLYANTEHQSIAREQALQIAEGGIDQALYQLNQNGSYSGETGTALDNGVFTISISTIDNNTRRITATGYVPNSANPIAVRTVKATANINTSVVSFRFGVEVGNGGVVMGNGSQINGNIFSDGSISGGGTVTGDATVAGGTQPNPDQQWQTQTNDFNFGDTSAHAAIAQSFVPSATNVLNKVSLYLKKVGVPGDIAIKIVTDNAGAPSTNVLASGVLPASSITGTYAFADATLATNPTLNGGQKYWIIGIAPVNASNYFIWGDDLTDGYALGTAKYTQTWNNTPWVALGGDVDFETWMGGVVTSLSGITVGGNAWAHSLSNCTITGNATYQTISSCTVGGTSFPGSADPSPAAMPIDDAVIANWESLAAAGGTLTGPYTIANNTTQTLGPVKINGNLTVNGTLKLAGPIWVNGNVTFGVGSSLLVDASTGTNGAVLIGDATGNTANSGTIYLANNMTIAGNGSPGSYPMVLSTNTGANALSMNNNATSIILYAAHGTVAINNNAVANQITAYSLNMANNTTVNYVSGLQSQSFSNGPGGSWVVVSGSYAISK